MDLKSSRLNKMFLYFFLKKRTAVAKTWPETWLYPSCLPDRGVSALTALSVVLGLQKCTQPRVRFSKDEMLSTSRQNMKFVLFAKNTEKYSQIIFVEFCSLRKLANDKAGHFGGKTWDQHSKRWLPTKSHIELYSLSLKLFSIKLKLLMTTCFWWSRNYINVI